MPQTARFDEFGRLMHSIGAFAQTTIYSYDRTDKATVRLIFLDQAGAALASAVPPPEAEIAWTQREKTAPVPANTRTIRVQMIAQRVDGIANDGYIDDLALSLVADGAAAAKPFIAMTNPDALAAGITGWTQSAGTIAKSTATPCNLFPCLRDGSFATDRVYQDIAIPAERVAEIDGLARGVEIAWIDRSKQLGNRTNVEVEFLDAADAPIVGAGSASPALSSVNAWTARSHFSDVPAGARKIRLTLQFSHSAVYAVTGAWLTGLTTRLVGRNIPVNSIDLLTSVDGPLPGAADTVAYSYDTQGNLSQVTDEVGHATQVLAVNTRGQPLTIRDENGVDTNLAYDLRGRLTTVTVNPGASQAVTSLEYDPAGQITKITAPDGSFLQYAWNNARRLTSVVNNTGEKI